MKAESFCYWLQGYFEIARAAGLTPVITDKQVDVIQNHLNLVFAHDIDPKAGGPDVQEVLNKLHAPVDIPVDKAKPQALKWAKPQSPFGPRLC